MQTRLEGMRGLTHQYSLKARLRAIRDTSGLKKNIHNRVRA
jgi:hypothetical protein